MTSRNQNHRLQIYKSVKSGILDNAMMRKSVFPFKVSERKERKMLLPNKTCSDTMLILKPQVLLYHCSKAHSRSNCFGVKFFLSFYGTGLLTEHLQTYNNPTRLSNKHKKKCYCVAFHSLLSILLTLGE